MWATYKGRSRLRRSLPGAQVDGAAERRFETRGVIVVAGEKRNGCAISSGGLSASSDIYFDVLVSASGGEVESEVFGFSGFSDGAQLNRVRIEPTEIDDAFPNRSIRAAGGRSIENHIFLFESQAAALVR